MIKILFQGRGSHGYYQVSEMPYNDRPSRVLFSGRAASQSGLALDEDPELLFDYNQRFLEIALSLQPKSVLIIGGGAFTFPKAMIERLDFAEVDTVEIDSLLPQLARDFFFLPNDPRLNLITADGRDYIDNCQKRYDLIVVDAFDEYTIPHRLITTEAAEQYAKLLSPGGVLSFNIISTYFGAPTIAHQIVASFSRAFGVTELYPSDPSYGQNREQNMIFVAHQGDSPNLDYLQSHTVNFRVPTDSSFELSD